MAEKNSTIIADVWLNATNDFQQRIPNPTQSSLDATVAALLDPMNNQYFNQFIDNLILRIGSTFVHQNSFKNPLAVFKKDKMMYGNTLQEIIPKWIRAHSYVDDAEDVFKMARPDVASWYHSQNRRDRYDITINEIELKNAFTEEYGLNKLVSAILQVPMNSDEYDEYLIMKQLIAMYEKNWGFYKHHLSGVPSDEATGKEFLKAVRTYARKLTFPNTIYNSGEIEDVPIFVKPNELVLLITPEIESSIDVDTLASVFNLDKAELKYRTIVIDEFPLPSDECVAILTTEDFFQCRDTVYENRSQYNPKTLGTNYFLHHWGIYSVSPFVPAIMFTTSAGTVVSQVTQTVTGITAAIDDNTIDAGDTAAITVTLQGTITPTTDGLTVAPDAATYDVSITRDGAGVNSPATRVDNYGILHTSKKLQSGDVITVVCTATYTNPSGATETYTDDVTATIN
jgi:hypothetical protein